MKLNKFVVLGVALLTFTSGINMMMLWKVFTSQSEWAPENLADKIFPYTVIGVVLGVFLLFLLVVWFFKCYRSSEKL